MKTYKLFAMIILMFELIFASFCLITGVSSTLIGMKNIVKTRITRDYQKNQVDKDLVNTVLISTVLVVVGLFLTIAGVYFLTL